MKIEKMNVITDMDLIDLAKTIQFCIKDITENNGERAIWTLCRLYENITENLKEDYNV